MLKVLNISNMHSINLKFITWSSTFYCSLVQLHFWDIFALSIVFSYLTLKAKIL